MRRRGRHTKSPMRSKAAAYNDAQAQSIVSSGMFYCDLVSRTRQARVMGEDGAARSETRAMVAWARDEILKLLHPFMPFITRNCGG